MNTGDTSNLAALEVETLQRLGDLLDEHAVGSGGVPLEAADGLIAAAIVSPGRPIDVDECLPLILGTEAWANRSAFDEASGLVRALWSDVGRRVCNDPERASGDVSPVIGVPPGFDEMSDQQIADSGYQMGSSWALGFVLGADLRREEWEQRFSRDEAVQSDFYDIFALMPDEVFGEDDDEGDGDGDGDEDIGDADDEAADALDDAFDLDDDDADEELSHADRVEVIEALPDILFTMNKARLKELS
ncbi:MAG: YecA family protein [Dokdonella sp.]